jgi:hypothetical protein
MSDRSLYRWGGAAAVIGAVVALVTNVLHPRITEYGDYVTSELTAVAESDGWIPIHLGLLLGSLLIVFGLFAVARSMKGGPAEGLARLALGGLLVAAPVAVLTLAVDGYATKAIADQVVGQQGQVDAASGMAVVEIGWALFMALVILFIGVTPALFGLAAVRSGIYPSSLAWTAVVLGAVAAGDGVMGWVAGPSAGFFWVFVATSGLLTLWVLILGVLVGRRARVAAA